MRLPSFFKTIQEGLQRQGKKGCRSKIILRPEIIGIDDRQTDLQMFHGHK